MPPASPAKAAETPKTINRYAPTGTPLAAAAISPVASARSPRPTRERTRLRAITLTRTTPASTSNAYSKSWSSSNPPTERYGRPCRPIAPPAQSASPSTESRISWSASVANASWGPRNRRVGTPTRTAVSAETIGAASSPTTVGTPCSASNPAVYAPIA